MDGDVSMMYTTACFDGDAAAEVGLLRFILRTECRREFAIIFEIALLDNCLLL